MTADVGGEEGRKRAAVTLCSDNKRWSATVAGIDGDWKITAESRGRKSAVATSWWSNDRGRTTMRRSRGWRRSLRFLRGDHATVVRSHGDRKLQRWGLEWVAAAVREEEGPAIAWAAIDVGDCREGTTRMLGWGYAEEGMAGRQQ
ncbi:hypothetical protein BHE74_00032390 [Ensete ventricosum]|nr:hypothetical protein GW17_00055931 [Ensete ventricosum]RWW60611.1 hypothetical protein BHE74_00032390 [Ensete ventricosum]RZS17808.1 hypothetical protein BHM03_00049991 [Ensete ventricosum]